MPGNVEPPHLLRTKLYRPRATGDLIHRPRMCELLDRYLDRAVTLVCAPAGFGKTTLLSDWLEHSPVPSAWLSLDKSDGDLGVFLSYFVAAIRTLFPAACGDTLAMLDAAVLPPLDPLVTTLANDLDRLADDPTPPSPQRFVLVLDDYHLIRESAVQTLLVELLHRPPRTMHLVLSARQEPPALLQTLRARGDLGEIRVRDLRFTSEEIALFMQQALGTPLDAETLANLAERSEGWGTGLRLAALTLSAGGDIAGQQGASAADNRYVLDYLLNEVLSRVPAATQDFLLKTSILDRLCGQLCDAVSGPVAPEWDGRAYLEWLAAENLFTFSLDAQGIWYRYHHLFRRLLQNRLERMHGAQEIAELHGRAAGWLAQNGLVEEAIDHALASGDETAAVQLVEAHRHRAMDLEHWRQLGRWLDMMPRGLIATRPELLMLEAWLLQQQWQYAALPPYLDRIEALLAQTPLEESHRTRLHAEIDVLRSLVFYYVFEAERSFSCAERALQRTPTECSTVRGFAWLYYAGGLHLKGDVQGALEALHAAFKEDRGGHDTFPTRIYFSLCIVHWMTAGLPKLLLTATQMLQVGLQRDLVEATCWAHYFRGCAFYHLNELAAAEEEFAAVVGQRYLAHSYTFSQSAFGLASVYQARGTGDRSRELIDSIASYGLEMNNKRIAADAEAFGALLALQRGAAVEAQRWAASYDPNTHPVPMTTFHVTLVSRARILVAAATPASHAEAAQALARLHDLAATTHNTRYLIEVLALKALLHDTLGDQDTASVTLKQAVDLGEPGGIIRVFVDLGPRMAALLHRLSARSGAPEYLRRLVAAFGEEAAPHPMPSRDGLIEPLSYRELDVLALLGERLSDKEIARELNISVNTAKRHALNIYQKLQVGSRREAVAKAVALGLIPAYQPPRERSESST